LAANRISCLSKLISRLITELKINKTTRLGGLVS
jgi:hypothetical protein